MLIAYWFLSSQLISEIIFGVISIVYLLYCVWVYKQNPNYRFHFLISLFFIFVAILFFSGEFQVASSIINYTKNFSKLHYFSVTIPAGSLISIESITVIVTALLLSRYSLLKQQTIPLTKVMLGVAFGFFAFLLLFMSTQINRPGLLLPLIVFCLLLLGIGDALLAPAMIAYIVKQSPEALKGRIIAGTYFAFSFAGYVSGLLGTTVSHFFKLTHQQGLFYHHVFLCTLLLMTVGLLCCFILRARIAPEGN